MADQSVDAWVFQWADLWVLTLAGQSVVAMADLMDDQSACQKADQWELLRVDLLADRWGASTADW